MVLTITERGWAGHFNGSNRCLFRRNTLIEFGEQRVVVSTVGLMQSRVEGELEPIGYNRYYETMAFDAEWEDPYWEADVGRQLTFESPWSLNEKERESDDKANKMHDLVVAELSAKMTGESK